MNEIETYSKLLRLRAIAKKVQNVSWTIAQIEKKFPLDNLSQDQHNELIQTYLDIIGRIQSILDELKEEKKNDKH